MRVVIHKMLAEMIDDVLLYLLLTHTTVTGKAIYLYSRSKIDE